MIQTSARVLQHKFEDNALSMAWSAKWKLKISI